MRDQEGEKEREKSRDWDRERERLGWRVELDSPSRTFLTWALCNVAQFGDRVIAFHVIDTSTSFCF